MQNDIQKKDMSKKGTPKETKFLQEESLKSPHRKTLQELEGCTAAVSQLSKVCSCGTKRKQHRFRR